MKVETTVEYGIVILNTWHNDAYTRLYICTMEDAKYYAKMKGYDDSDCICTLLHASYLRSTYVDVNGFFYIVEA